MLAGALRARPQHNRQNQVPPPAGCLHSGTGRNAETPVYWKAQNIKVVNCHTRCTSSGGRSSPPPVVPRHLPTAAELATDTVMELFAFSRASVLRQYSRNRDTIARRVQVTQPVIREFTVLPGKECTGPAAPKVTPDRLAHPVSAHATSRFYQSPQEGLCESGGHSRGIALPQVLLPSRIG